MENTQLRNECTAWKAIAVSALLAHLKRMPPAERAQAVELIISHLRAAVQSEEARDLAMTMELCIDDLQAHARAEGLLPE